MKVLLDTNAYSELLRGNEAVHELLENSDKIYMSVIVVAELLTGFKGGSKEKQNIEILNEFNSNPKVLIIDVTTKTAAIFSEIKHYLKTKGLAIPINDVLIAAQSFEFQSTIITFDKHFSNIPKIKVHEMRAIRN